MSDSNEVLVVASKIKGYIKQSGDMKTSAGVLDVRPVVRHANDE